jgi:hypothetical protein
MMILIIIIGSAGNAAAFIAVDGADGLGQHFSVDGGVELIRLRLGAFAAELAEHRVLERS